jgi:hypothetical protein
MPLAASKSTRTESRAKFVSTTLPAPRPAIEKTWPTSNGSHFSAFSARASPSAGSFASRNLKRPRRAASEVRDGQAAERASSKSL